MKHFREKRKTYSKGAPFVPKKGWIPLWMAQLNTKGREEGIPFIRQYQLVKKKNGVSSCRARASLDREEEGNQYREQGTDLFHRREKGEVAVRKLTGKHFGKKGGLSRAQGKKKEANSFHSRETVRDSQLKLRPAIGHEGKRGKSNFRWGKTLPSHKERSHSAATKASSVDRR